MDAANTISLIYSMSAPLYFLLALIIPVILGFIILKTITVYRVLATSLYKRRLLATSFTYIFSILYVESHSIAAVLGLDYIPFGIDNLFGVGIFIATYLTVESFISIATRYDPVNSKKYISLKKILASLLAFCVSLLLIASFFLGYPIYDTFITLFGIGFVPFTVLVFYTLMLIRKKLDPNSQSQIFWIYIILIAFASVGLVDTLFDVINLPVFLNMLSIPSSFVALYAVYKSSSRYIETERRRSETTIIEPTS